MTISLTINESSNSTANPPPTPTDMTSITTEPLSPPPPPPAQQSSSSNILAALETSSAASVTDNEEESTAIVVNESVESPVAATAAVESDKKLSDPLDSTAGDETEEETSEYAGEDEPSNVISSPKSTQSDTKVQADAAPCHSKRTRDKASHSDQCDNSSKDCDEANADSASVDLPVQCDQTSKRLKTTSDVSEPAKSKSNSRNSATNHSDQSVNESVALVKCKISDSHSVNREEMSSDNVGEMARLRAAKFIQERTKMACLLPSAAEAETAKMATNSVPASTGQHGSSRKRKLTVKDILVSQRTRDVGNSKQQRVHNESAHSNVNNSFGLNQMFPGLGQMLDPSLHMNDSNPFAAILAAAAAANNSNGSISANGTNIGPGLVPDSQSAYISTLASSLSSNANPTATLALMASLSAMMQNSNTNKDVSVDGGANPLSQMSNPLVSLESTLANAVANNFGTTPAQSSSVLHNSSATPDADNDRIGTAPLDFSLKNFIHKNDEKTSARRKSRKRINGGEGSNEEEIPLDLSVPTKRPEELINSKVDHPLNPMFSQVQGDAPNGNNFAAMAAAAAAAAAFSPNLLTKMAASMGPWSGYGAMQNSKMTNDSSAATAAFTALLQQVNNVNNSSPSKSSKNTPISPIAAAGNGANLFQSFPDLYWNGKFSGKTSTSSPSFGGISNSAASYSTRHQPHQPPPAASQPMRTKSSSGRQNPWQAQWINRSSEQTRDVFTCVWCKESFKSLAEMTDHMKRSPRCGMAGMQQHHSHHHHPSPATNHHSQSPASQLGPSAHPSQSSATTKQHQQQQQLQQQQQQQASHSSPSHTIPVSKESSISHNSSSTNPTVAAPNHNTNHTNNHHSSNQSSNAHQSNVLGSGKPAGVNMPRKLVRGQDVWLGRGAEQTRQILKCMWCGQSFKSLADMTQHMKVTQHYTNIISQEQITSWRTPDEKIGQTQVNAVLTCKVCDEPFSTLKELSNHMVKNSHFKDNPQDSNGGGSRSGASTPTSIPAQTSSASVSSSRGGRSPAVTTPNTPTPAPASSDRRKKSLPVRKLLELERGEFKNDEDDMDEFQKLSKSIASQLIECDDCHDKIEPRCFLQHIKQCRLRNIKSDPDSDMAKSVSDKEADDQSTNIDSESIKDEPKNDEDDDADDDDKASEKETDRSDLNQETKSTNANTGDEPGSSSGSVLNALEKLIEKNFDSKSRRSQQTGILQRLGIDEEVFPPWQNMAPSPLSAMSPTMAAWNSLNGVEFSRSNSSSSNNSRANAIGIMPQLRYRRNSSSASLKDKFLLGLNVKTPESNGSFSSQETEEEESCDESDYLNGAHRSQKKPSASRSQADKSRLNFPISSLLSSPLPARPTSASSTASSISPHERVSPSQAVSDQLHRMTPSSHRSAQEDDDDDNEFSIPLALCKKSPTSSAAAEEFDSKKGKVNGTNDDAPSDNANDNSERGKQSHHPLMQLQKLLDKTDTSTRHSGSKSATNSNHRLSSPFGWHDSASAKAISPASSPLTPPIAMQHSPLSISAKSDDASSYLLLKCAFCDTQIASRIAYRSHLAKVHLSMRDSIDLSAISDEELLLLVLAKNSNLQLPTTNHNLLAVAAAASATNTTKVSSRSNQRESSSKRKSAKVDSGAWDKSPNNASANSNNNNATANNSPSPSSQLETSQSKFLKYTELAKQLSSKYV